MEASMDVGIITKNSDRLLIPELAVRGTRTSPALPLWLKLVELNGLEQSQKLGYVFASQKWLAKELGYSSEPNGTFRNGARTIQRHLDNLHSLGILHWARVGRDRNHYFLEPRAIEETRRKLSQTKGDKNVAYDVASEATKMSSVYTDSDLKKEELTKSASARAASPKKIPNPNHHPLVKFFCDSWREQHGARYPFGTNAGFNARCISDILAATDNDLVEAKRIVRDYFDDPDWWISTNKHPLPYLVKNLQRYIGHAEPLVNSHGCYTRPRKLTREEIEREIQEADARRDSQGR